MLNFVDNVKKAKESKKMGQTAKQQVKDTKQADTAKLVHMDPEANTPLTLLDMERLLTSMEERIVAKLSAQLLADRANIDQHHKATHQLETAANDTQTRIEKLESTCAALFQKNEDLKVKLDEQYLHHRTPRKHQGPTSYSIHRHTAERNIWSISFSYLNYR